jgi:hypothetical protein
MHILILDLMSGGTRCRTHVRWVGLGIVPGLLLVHVLLLAATTVMLFLITNRSFLGNSWRAVAKIFTSDTEGILAYPSDMSDRHVEKHLDSQGKGKIIFRIKY